MKNNLSSYNPHCKALPVSEKLLMMSSLLDPEETEEAPVRKCPIAL